jgi:neurotransmitter:Na+ symporter, NSS family
MTRRRKSIHGQWSSRWAFILAAGGSAVGLGNVWKFPYITGQNGGGTFVLVYLLTISVIAIPIMMAEVMLGRRGRQSPINTMRDLAREAGASRWWMLMGVAGMLAGFLILSYYSVVAGWALAYVFKAAWGTFTGLSGEQVGQVFGAHVGDAGLLLFWHTVMMVMTMTVVSRGVKSGLEQAVRWMMPALFMLLLVLVGYAMSTGGFVRALEFLFTPGAIGPAGVLVAMGHAFFTLSLGMGAIMMYGSYLRDDTSIGKTVITVAGLDTLVALLAGLAIFPLVFAYDLPPGAGPGLIFATLPIAFGALPGGAFFGTLFFVLLVFAAWTSAISLIEPAVAWLVENHGFKRLHAAIAAGVATWLLGIATVLSFNRWESYTLFGKTVFEIIDFLTANIMLPLGGLAIAVFTGWFMSRKVVRNEMAIEDRRLHELWWLLIKYVAPVGILIVFLNLLGVY